MVAVVFPGQGSQHPGMGKSFYESDVGARSVFDEVQRATQVDVARLCFASDEDTLRQTQNAQLALYTCSVAAFRVFEEKHGSSVVVQAVAGHSVGEYAALTSAGLLTVADGAKLVQRRGDLMARSGNLRHGAMAAVLGLEKDVLDRVCAEASDRDSVVVIANDNSPGQVVISGDYTAVQRAEILAKERGAKRVLMLNVSGAFHSPLMEEPAQAMGLALKPQVFEFDATMPHVYSNVTADRVDTVSSWPILLEAQLRSPVRWVESVQNMIRDGVTVFVECGAGEVLCGLIRRISKDVKAIAVNDQASLEKSPEALAG